MAKGARRPKSLLLAATQFLCYGEYMMYQGTHMHHLNSCEVIELFYNLRMDIDKLELAAKMTKIVSDVTTENQKNEKVLRLLLNTLYIISEKEKNLELVYAVFKLRLLSIIGYMPNIKMCGNCKTEEKFDFFSIRKNGFLCEVCGKQDKSCVKMALATKDAIQYSVFAPLEKLYLFEIPTEAVNELKVIAKLYLNEKLEKEYK